MAVLKYNALKDLFSEIWITSDTHYGHKNICRGVTDWRMPDGSIPITQTRDFSSIEIMNESIINGINDVVGQDDLLIHLGDWSFGGIENIGKFRERIICGDIYLILGNHDHHIERNKEHVRDHFTAIYDYVTLYYDKNMAILSHYPFSSWNNLNKGSIHLHGHTHFSNEKKNLLGRRMDVGLDGHMEFRPYHLIDECINVLKTREIKSELNQYDHHLDELTGRIG